MDVCSSKLTTYCHTSLPYITNFVTNAIHQRIQPTPSHCTICQYVECHLLILILILFFFFWCHLLIIGACIFYILEKAKWSGPQQQRWGEIEFKFHSVTSYTDSIISCIHVNTTKLCNIMCSLVVTCVILRSLECNCFRQHWPEDFPLTGRGLIVQVTYGVLYFTPRCV